MKPARSLRRGVAISVVMGFVVLLFAALVPMLFFSGSQTRSMLVEGEDWRARHMARAGLAVAAERLRVGRWYGEESLMGEVTSEEVGLPGPDRFRVLCEDTRVFAEWPVAGFKFFPYLHHIDVFARGEADGRAIVAYGAFIMNPAPELGGSATDAYGDDGPGSTDPDTLKRLVRVAYFREPELRDIDQASVRDAIRARVKEKTGEYLPNYLAIDWDTRKNPPAAPAASLGEGEAQAFLESFSWSNPAHAESVFLRDRVFVMLLEGTPAQQRAVADSLRTVSIRTDEEAEATRAQARFFCELVDSCTWGPFPPESETLMLPPNAVALLHEARDGTPDPGYRARLAAHDCAKLYYRWGAEYTELKSEVTEAEVQARYPGLPYAEWGGEWWIDYWARQDENPCVSADYRLDDPASGLDLELDTIYGFFRKYYELEKAKPMGASGIAKSNKAALGYTSDPAMLALPDEVLLGPGAGDEEGAGGGGGESVSRRAAF